MKETYIVIGHIGTSTVDEIEELDGTHYDILITFMNKYPNYEVLTLAEFCKEVNMSDIAVSSFWLSYITVGN